MPTIEILRSPLKLHGKVGVPGSKSITNRALLVAALATGKSSLSGVLVSDDTRYMVKALTELGVCIRFSSDTCIDIEGTGTLKQPCDSLYLGNAGTAIRFLTAACALVKGTVVLNGDEHMQKRPIHPLIDALNAAGIHATVPSSGCPPCQVHGQGSILGGTISVSGNLSSQFLSSLMLVAPLAKQSTTIKLAEDTIGALGYIEITRSVMNAFGAHVYQDDEKRFHIANTGYNTCDFKVEPDASAATYFWAAETLTGGMIDLGYSPSDFSQPDVAAHTLMQSFPSLPSCIDGAQLQDAIPTLAVLAAFGYSKVRFTGIANLRVKECDRIAAVHKGLNCIKPGLATIEGDDLIVIGDPELPTQARPCTIDTMSDHRIAMSFALAGLKCRGIKILDPKCVDKTFPNYWSELSKLGVSFSYA
ncbi:3-phosphoshikimate 1-carboxyvinyltransferase [Halomonas alkaliantarctica]|uniref:3-phosphoshikimate 1-carboxyvinyltransferase n=1 Tax=Halomonas alkaliantarctica TaxID=232346 RepID=A0ABY8LIK5_9GAMM|nr:3-phosphoshikimate 1-carboxyvinyltransferase [Halomonas alkaliantarctica]WGI24269.1 3-phosphoshikimate 1-carboxyvinyltransferase [Halomonas alkaliantarctica]